MNIELYNEIIYWLKSNRNFKEGVVIYSKFGSKKKLLKRFIRSGATDFNHGLLRSELEEYARIMERQIKTEKVKIFNKPKTETISQMPPQVDSVDFALKPVEIQELETKKYVAFMQAHIARFKDLPNAETPEQRAQAVENVVNLMAENQRCWDILKSYSKNGTLPDKVPVQSAKKNSDDPLKMQKTITNRRSNVSNYKRFIKENPDHSSIEQKQQRIHQWDDEIQTLEAKLKSLSVTESVSHVV